MIEMISRHVMNCVMKKFVNQNLVKILMLAILALGACDKKDKKSSPPPPPPPPPPPAPITSTTNLSTPLPSQFTIENEISVQQFNSSLYNIPRLEISALTPGLPNTVLRHVEQHLIDGTLLQSMDLNYEVKFQATKKNKIDVTKTVLNSLYQSKYGSGPFADTKPVSVVYRVGELEDAMGDSDFETIAGVMPDPQMWSANAPPSFQFQMQNCWVTQSTTPTPAQPQGNWGAGIQLKVYAGRYLVPGGAPVQAFIMHKQQLFSLSCYTQGMSWTPPVQPGAGQPQPTTSNSQIQVEYEEVSISVPKAIIIGNFGDGSDSQFRQYQRTTLKVVGGPIISSNSMMIVSPVAP